MSTTEVSRKTPPNTVYRIAIRSTRESVWEALTAVDVPRSWMWHTTIHSSWAVGAPYAMSSGDTDLIVGTVLTYDRPDRLVMTFDARWDELSAVEPAGQLEYLLTDSGDGVTELTVIISGLSGHSAVSVAADTPGIYSGVKSLLETGAPLR